MDAGRPEEPYMPSGEALKKSNDNLSGWKNHLISIITNNLVASTSVVSRKPTAAKRISSHLHYFVIRDMKPQEPLYASSHTVVMWRTADDQEHNPALKDTLDDARCKLAAQEVSEQKHNFGVAAAVSAWEKLHNSIIYFYCFSII